MPDNFDYEWLGSLLANPEGWSKEDFESVRFMIVNQQRAIRELHPKDASRRQSMQTLVDQLQAALSKYRGKSEG